MDAFTIEYISGSSLPSRTLLVPYRQRGGGGGEGHCDGCILFLLGPDLQGGADLLTRRGPGVGFLNLQVSFEPIPPPPISRVTGWSRLWARSDAHIMGLI